MVFETVPPLKVLRIRLHSKSHWKRFWHFFGPWRVRMRKLLLMISWDSWFLMLKQNQCCCAGCRWSMGRLSLLLRSEQNTHHPAIISVLFLTVLNNVIRSNCKTNHFIFSAICGCGGTFSLSDTEWREWREAIVLTVVSCCWQLKHCQRKEFCFANWTNSNVCWSTGQSSQCPGQVVPLIM